MLVVDVIETMAFSSAMPRGRLNGILVLEVR
jgi:hypothetical protein